MEHSDHLDKLENQSIFILREAYKKFKKPNKFKWLQNFFALRDTVLRTAAASAQATVATWLAQPKPVNDSTRQRITLPHVGGKPATQSPQRQHYGQH